jgi:hypothetical protein
MLIVDEPGTRQANKPDNKFTDSEVAAGKIIDFEKARKALEKDRFCQRTAEERERKIFRSGLQPSSGELLELLVTIALILTLLLSFLVAAFQRL